MFLAVDGDILLYRAASAAETEIDWGDDFWSLYTDLNDAKSVASSAAGQHHQQVGHWRLCGLPV